MFFRAEDQSQLQLVQREEIDDEEELFEAIDKCEFHARSFLFIILSSFAVKFNYRFVDSNYNMNFIFVSSSNLRLN